MKLSNVLHEDLVVEHMSTDLPLLDSHMTVAQALDFILENSVSERIIYFYVVDDERHLLGVIPTRRLLTTPRDRYLADIMITRIVKLPQTANVLIAL